jgi:energy-coupling factor transport system permease protein
MSGIGQYVPVDSPLHRLDAAAKIGMVAAYTAGLFMVGPPGTLRGLVGLLAVGATMALAVMLSRVPMRALARGLRAVALLLLVTMVFNSVKIDATSAALVRLGRFSLDLGGLGSGAFFAARIVLLVTGTALLTLTTSPIELTSGIERVLAPLKLLRLPVGDLAMTLTIALRFIPTTAEEAERIVTAQEARGAVFDRGGPVARARAYIPVLVPVFYQLFRRADALATAMEARCYRGTEGRTRLRDTRMRAADWMALGVVAAGMIAVGWFL